MRITGREPIASLAAAAPAANGMDEDGPIKGDMVSAAFAKLERQQRLLATCARHYQQPADHFASPVRGLIARSDALRTSTKAARNQRAFETPHRREGYIDASDLRVLDLRSDSGWISANIWLPSAACAYASSFLVLMLADSRRAKTWPTNT